MSRKSKKQPYREIIDLNCELKEYKKLCRRKSKKYNYYLEWKKHIISELEKLDTNEKQDNFKHYLMNYNRVSESANKQFVPIMIFAYNIAFSYMFSEKEKNLFVILSVIIISAFLMLLFNEKNNKEYYLNYDILEILNEIQKDNEKNIEGE